MIIRQLSRLSLMLVASILVSACKNGLVYNDDTSGAIFVKAKEPEPKPIPKPFIQPKPQKKGLSIAQQNERAISSFSSRGFETVLSEKGVVVYLPPPIYFKDSESSITLAARMKIAEVAKELNQPYLSERYIEVSGHTDTLGSESMNLALSKERALAATAELVFSKVPKTRLSSVWFGETQLRAPELNNDGTVNLKNRNFNRRVEFTILNPE